jgi:hypothetical protein
MFSPLVLLCYNYEYPTRIIVKYMKSYNKCFLPLSAIDNMMVAAQFIKRGINCLQFNDDFDIILELGGFGVPPSLFIWEISNKRKESP